MILWENWDNRSTKICCDYCEKDITDKAHKALDALKHSKHRINMNGVRIPDTCHLKSQHKVRIGKYEFVLTTFEIHKPYLHTGV